MHYSRWLLAACAVSSAVVARAGDTPRYEPAPAWVKPAPPIDLTKMTGNSGALLVLDQQTRLQDGQVWSYIDVANRILSEQMMAQAGTIRLGWQPAQGDLIVHRIVIVRDGREIDALAGSEKLTVLRRELGLETLTLDGLLTATMPMPGLQVGDVIRMTYSTTAKDPLLLGQVQAFGILLSEPVHPVYGRLRALWSAKDNVKWQALAPIEATPVDIAGGFRELTVTLPLAKPKELPNDAPIRFNALPLLELSSFADWQAVSRTMAPLFKVDGLVKPGGTLAAEIARIKASSTDPRVRAAGALRVVQGDIRYLFKGMDNGNYQPQAPETTWQVRYGDCKAKTLLLLAMLDGLGVEAEAVLANTELNDFLSKRLPSAAAFNHVLVRATIAGETYWLDGTQSGTRLADLGNTPLLRQVLPLRTAGAALLPVKIHPNARPTIALDVDLDATAGVLLPVPYVALITLTGPLSEGLRTAATGLTGEKRKEELDKFVNGFLPGANVATREASYDAASGAAVLRSTGLITPDWSWEAHRYQMEPRSIATSMDLGGVRGRPEWRAIPVATPGVGGYTMHTRMRLPEGGKGFDLENDRALPAVLAGPPVGRTVTRTGDAIVVDERFDEVGAEIEPADIAPAKAALTLAKSRPLKFVAPAGYPMRWQVIRAASAAGRLKPIEAVFVKMIEDAPEKAPVYYRRSQYRASIYSYKTAIEDLDRAIAERRETYAYRARANLLWSMGEGPRAIADLKTAYELDPSASATIMLLSYRQAQYGEASAALVRLDEQIEAGGDQKPRMQSAKAEVLAFAGKVDEAIAVLDAAIKEKPGNADLLNGRCWLKGTRNVALDSALKDCNRAIEFADDGSAMVLNSRAMVFYRLRRLDEALADLDAALEIDPDENDSHMLRGIIRLKRGDKAGAELDLTQARTADPRLEGDYKKFGVSI